MTSADDERTKAAERSPSASVLPDLEPMSWSLLGRFFGVPLLIVGTIVSGAVLVVLLFGGPAAPAKQSVESLLQALEASSGEKSAGILLPREKELWQTALELSERLRNKSTELTPEEVDTVSNRLAAMVARDLEQIDRVTAFGDDLPKQQALRSGRFEFLLRALGRTQTPLAVSTLLQVLDEGQEPFVTVAIQELADLRAVPQAREAKEPILRALAESSRPETLLVASTALSVLADKDDMAVIDALASLRLKSEGEVSWSAALALARLGSPSGKTTLLDLLDREFWQTHDRYEVIDETGQVRRYPMPPERIEALMIASIAAASNLTDSEIRSAIETLKSDPSHAVRGAAIEALEDREKPALSEGTA